MDQLPRLEREFICLLLFTCNYVVSVLRGFLFLWGIGMGYVILLWHSLSLHIIILHTMKKQRRGLNIETCMTDGDTRSVKRHHWKSEAKEDHQLSLDGPSKRRKLRYFNLNILVLQSFVTRGCLLVSCLPMCEHKQTMNFMLAVGSAVIIYGRKLLFM